MIFEDENNQQLYREDIISLDIMNLLKTTDEFIKIWRTFNTEKKPNKWIVWPYSESKGWLDKIEGKI